MTNAKTIKQAIAWAAVETAETALLAINENDRRHSTCAEHSSASENF